MRGLVGISHLRDPRVLKYEASTMALEWYSPRRMIFEDGNKEVKKRERKGRRGHGTSTEAAGSGQLLGRLFGPHFMLSSVEDRIRTTNPVIL